MIRLNAGAHSARIIEDSQTMIRLRHLLPSLSVYLICSAAAAFDGHKVTAGPITLTIGEIPSVTMYNEPQQIGVTVSNAADRPVDVLLEVKDLVDTPLPDGDAFALTLRVDTIVGRSAKVRAVEAIDREDKKTREIDFRTVGQEVSFTTNRDDFAYQVCLD
jgi:hypothetical protein